MCARYFQQAEDAGHPPEAGVGVRVLQTGDGALQDVQHALVHLPAHFLQTRRRNKVVQCLVKKNKKATKKRGGRSDWFLTHKHTHRALKRVIDKYPMLGYLFKKNSSTQSEKTESVDAFQFKMI